MPRHFFLFANSNSNNVKNAAAFSQRHAVPPHPVQKCESCPCRCKVKASLVFVVEISEIATLAKSDNDVGVRVVIVEAPGSEGISLTL